MVDQRQIKNIADDEQAVKLLSDFELIPPKDPDYTLGLYEDGLLIGCASLKGNMIQGLAIDKRQQGKGMSAVLVTRLIERAASMGITHLLVFTKPEMSQLICDLGFRMIADASPYAVFLEYGNEGVGTYVNKLHEIAGGKPKNCSSIVMNCNPFTKGHRYLIEQSSKSSEFVYVIAVQEDVSLFPFSVRFELIKEGVKDLKNVLVIPGGEYVISSLTFPAYFTREENLALANGTMDAAVFAAVVAPALNITRRYVGTEPYCKATGIYNDILKRYLPQKGIEVVEIARISLDDKAISASAVRNFIKNDQWEEVEKLVPETTFNFLKSDRALPIINKIKMGNSLH